MNDDAALDRFKRIQCEKSTLSDSITVQRILTEQKGLPNILVSADFILSNINKVAHSLHQSSNFISPEIFAENLLVVGAQKVSEVSLSDKALFIPKDFRSVASAVHKACRFLEKKYSHIDLGAICKKLVQNWLIHAGSTNALVESGISGKKNDKLSQKT